jgi:hypothetical protein
VEFQVQEFTYSFYSFPGFFDQVLELEAILTRERHLL